MNTERDYQSYKTYLDLWAGENPIKTNKLQVLLAVNAILVAGLQAADGPKIENWPIFTVGALLSIVWVLSIGRTALFQKVWQEKIKELSLRHQDDPRFQVLDTRTAETRAPGWLRVLGGVSSKYYLLGAPVVLASMWLIGLACIWSSS